MTLEGDKVLSCGTWHFMSIIEVRSTESKKQIVPLPGAVTLNFELKLCPTSGPRVSKQSWGKRCLCPCQGTPVLSRSTVQLAFRRQQSGFTGGPQLPVSSRLLPRFASSSSGVHMAVVQEVQWSSLYLGALWVEWPKEGASEGGLLITPSYSDFFVHSILPAPASTARHWDGTG